MSVALMVSLAVVDVLVELELAKVGEVDSGFIATLD